LRITRAAITPGTQPHKVNIKVIIKDPQPLSTTAKGGKIIAKKTRQILIISFDDLMCLYDANLLKLLHFYHSTIQLFHKNV